MSNVVQYGDYQGSVTYDNGVLLLQILHIDDVILAECNSAAEVKDAFKDLVEDYLETCREVGKEPCRSFKGNFNVRVAPDLHRRAAMAAAAEGVSLNVWIGAAMKEKLDGAAQGRDFAHDFLSLTKLTAERLFAEADRNRAPLRQTAVARPEFYTRSAAAESRIYSANQIAARRQGRQGRLGGPRRDVQSRPAGAARLHHHHRGLHLVLRQRPHYPPTEGAGRGGARRCRRSPAAPSAIRSGRCWSRCAPARAPRCPA
jgi:predicted HicB family RNase H-like nuclease